MNSANKSNSGAMPFVTALLLWAVAAELHFANAADTEVTTAEANAGEVTSTVGTLALLLNPTRLNQPEKAATDAPAEGKPSETLLGDWGGIRSTWEDHGYDFTVQYIGEAMSNRKGGNKQGTVYRGLLNVAAVVDGEKALGWSGSQFHTSLFLPHGRSITDNYVGDSFAASNLDADHRLHLFELWLEQSFADDKINVRIGQIAVDQEFVFTEQGALFNNATFGWFPIVGATTPVYPQGAPGIRIRWNTCEQSYLQLAVADGDIDPNGDNARGTKIKLDEGAILFAEAGYNWESNGKPGSIKLGGWYHTADTDHLRTDNTGLSLADPGTSGVAQNLKGNGGLYAAAEQVLWREHPDDKESKQGFGCFGRLGYAPSDRNNLSFYGEAGVTSTGLLPGRDDDVCGCAIALGQVGSSARRYVRDDNFFNATGAAVPDHEVVIEAEYQFNIRAGLAVQPGVQYILHPGGSTDIKDALIIGIRTIIDF